MHCQDVPSSVDCGHFLFGVVVSMSIIVDSDVDVVHLGRGTVAAIALTCSVVIFVIIRVLLLATLLVQFTNDPPGRGCGRTKRIIFQAYGSTEVIVVVAVNRLCLLLFVDNLREFAHTAPTMPSSYP